jgi:hypothetical protein
VFLLPTVIYSPGCRVSCLNCGRPQLSSWVALCHPPALAFSLSPCCAPEVHSGQFSPRKSKPQELVTVCMWRSICLWPAPHALSQGEWEGVVPQPQGFVAGLVPGDHWAQKKRAWWLRELFGEGREGESLKTPAWEGTGVMPDRHLPQTEEGHQRLNVAEKQG